MKGLYTKSLLFLIVALLVLLLQWDTVIINLIVFLTLQRGIISQNCFWWGINDMFQDSTGADIYQKLKRDRFVQLNIFGKQIYLLTDINDIKELLDDSPNPFGPGFLKKNFFNSFIPRNVGISENPEWKYKRNYNDKVLETDHYHHMNPVFDRYIKELLEKENPRRFDEFGEFTRKLTSRILFGTYEYNPIIYTVFKQADSLFSARFNLNTVNPEDLQKYRDYLRYELENPKPNTILSIAHKYHRMLPIEDVIDQIPHWVFPIAGLFSVHLPRLLVLLLNHPNDLRIVIQEIQEKKIYEKDTYTRKCILELFRVNNAVNSTFRGLTDSYTFSNSDIIFPKETQFVFFNNPVLRDLFEQPNEYIPSRWTLELEDDIRALMFNQANQKCPGKELTLSLLTMGLAQYLEKNNFRIKTNIKLTPEFIPYIINPCTIQFEH